MSDLKNECKVIRIGRSDSNDLVMSQPQISGSHATITPLGANSLILEDLNSTNGTFVNDIRVHRAIINHDDRVKLANVLLDTDPFFADPEEWLRKVRDEKRELTIPEQFKLREEIWEAYQYYKLNNKKKDFWKNIGLTAAGMGVGALFVPVTGGISLMAGSLAGRGVGGMLKNDEKNQIVENEFKINYTCPKCKVFLGYNPYEGLVQRKKCFTCKTQWIEE
jgi:hypothetical protein